MNLSLTGCKANPRLSGPFAQQFIDFDISNLGYNTTEPFKKHYEFTEILYEETTV